jgi:Arc/MetJ-type ribon-helix-helix transcriptional regulator
MPQISVSLPQDLVDLLDAQATEEVSRAAVIRIHLRKALQFPLAANPGKPEVRPPERLVAANVPVDTSPAVSPLEKLKQTPGVTTAGSLERKDVTPVPK